LAHVFRCERALVHAAVIAVVPVVSAQHSFRGDPTQKPREQISPDALDCHQPSPIVVMDLVWVGNADGNLYALR
jgi:hypothetical protein